MDNTESLHPRDLWLKEYQLFSHYIKEKNLISLIHWTVNNRHYTNRTMRAVVEFGSAHDIQYALETLDFKDCSWLCEAIVFFRKNEPDFIRYCTVTIENFSGAEIAWLDLAVDIIEKKLNEEKKS